MGTVHIRQHLGEAAQSAVQARRAEEGTRGIFEEKVVPTQKPRKHVLVKKCGQCEGA